MKSRSLYIVIALLVVTTSFAQSNSYTTLKNKFKSQPEVYSFSVSGWMGRMVLNLAGEYEFRDAIKELKHVRLITIPHQAFSDQQVSVKGFKKVLKQDAFHEMAVIRDHGDEVSIYLREGNNNKNHYFVLIEDDREVIALELSGYLDPQLLNTKHTTLVNK